MSGKSDKLVELMAAKGIALPPMVRTTGNLGGPSVPDIERPADSGEGDRG